MIEFNENTLGFMAKTDLHSITMMEDFFLKEDGYTYFIENKLTQEWLKKDGTWTNNPHACLHFKTYPKAFNYGMENKVVRFIVTEHEYVKTNK